MLGGRGSVDFIYWGGIDECLPVLTQSGVPAKTLVEKLFQFSVLDLIDHHSD